MPEASKHGYIVELMVQLTEFQKKVYEVVKKIPRGQTRTYKWVARMIGKPSAYRAVGLALSRNTRPDTIPCHRVIRSDGSLGGYKWDARKKAMLLAKEKRIRYNKTKETKCSKN
ncbi:MAG: MGMT family protein [Candidatus Omnitrophota bacterium]